MKLHVVNKYECELCGSMYDTPERASICESAFARDTELHERLQSTVGKVIVFLDKHKSLSALVVVDRVYLSNGRCAEGLLHIDSASSNDCYGSSWLEYGMEVLTISEAAAAGYKPYNLKTLSNRNPKMYEEYVEALSGLTVEQLTKQVLGGIRNG